MSMYIHIATYLCVNKIKFTSYYKMDCVDKVREILALIKYVMKILTIEKIHFTKNYFAYV